MVCFHFCSISRKTGTLLEYFSLKKWAIMAERSLLLLYFNAIPVSKALNSTQGYSWLSVFILKTVWSLTLTSYRTVYYFKNYTRFMACLLSDDVYGRIGTYSSKSQVTELQNHRMAWAGNELQDQLVPASDPVPFQALHAITGTSCFPLCHASSLEMLCIREIQEKNTSCTLLFQIILP